MNKSINTGFDELISETLTRLPNASSIDWRPAVTSQVTMRSDIAWCVKWLALTEEQARRQANDPDFIAYKTILMEYLSKGIPWHPLVSEKFRELHTLINERRKLNYWGTR